MKPGSEMPLPKADKRYKIGTIKKDKKGRYRGHPKTVLPTRIETALIGILNPPIVISEVLSRHLKHQERNK